GAVEVLDMLISKGYRVGILTRGGRRYATTVLGEAGVLRKFNAIVARDDYPEEEAKPNPLALDHLAAAMGVKSREILYLGDGIVDFMTADASGASFIGVETGPNSADMWHKKVGWDIRIIPSVAELKDLI
ncbi:MAG: HAD-IA family hydrolase, partial [Methanomethylophilus sp.]|nr:HAD-IA family hydrolase [Methanomethylophilus sp.]